MRKIKNKHRKRTDHLFAKAVLRMLFFQYTGKLISPNKVEMWCWLDGNRKGIIRRGRLCSYRDSKNSRCIIVWFNGRHYSAPDNQRLYLERCSMNMAEYKRLNSH